MVSIYLCLDLHIYGCTHASIYMTYPSTYASTLLRVMSNDYDKHKPTPHALFSIEIPTANRCDKMSALQQTKTWLRRRRCTHRNNQNSQACWPADSWPSVLPSVSSSRDPLSNKSSDLLMLSPMVSAFQCSLNLLASALRRKTFF